MILVRYSEIGLKSTPVRLKFENRLKDNILSMFAADGVEALVYRSDGRFYVESGDTDAAISSLKRVFGVASVSVAVECTAALDDICSTAAEYSKGRLSQGQSFAVRARREGNHHPYTSMDVGREAGSAIFLENEHLGIKVNLTDPEVIFYVEVRNNRAFVYGSYVRCHAGFPIGTQGRVIAYTDDDRGTLSAWLMMKRGCKVYLKGDHGHDLLAKYDPSMREEQGSPKRIVGYVRGNSFADMEGYQIEDYDLPTFFPTVGMTDEEVSDMIEMMKNE